MGKGVETHLEKRSQGSEFRVQESSIPACSTEPCPLIPASSRPVEQSRGLVFAFHIDGLNASIRLVHGLAAAGDGCGKFLYERSKFTYPRGGVNIGEHRIAREREWRIVLFPAIPIRYASLFKPMEEP